MMVKILCKLRALGSLWNDLLSYSQNVFWKAGAASTSSMKENIP